MHSMLVNAIKENLRVHLCHVATIGVCTYDVIFGTVRTGLNWVGKEGQLYYTIKLSFALGADLMKC